MTGTVCPKHQEYAPNGICRWCEPPSSESPIEKRLEAAHVAAAQVEMHRQLLESQAQQGQGLGFWLTPFSNSQIKDNKP